MVPNPVFGAQGAAFSPYLGPKGPKGPPYGGPPILPPIGVQSCLVSLSDKPSKPKQACDLLLSLRGRRPWLELHRQLFTFLSQGLEV